MKRVRWFKSILATLVISCCLFGCGDTTQTTSSESNRQLETTVNNAGLNQYGMGAGKQDTATEDFDKTDISGTQPGASNQSETGTKEGTAGEVSGEDRAYEQGITDGSTLEVHYIDIGQGDSVLIKQGDASMLIDAGNNDKGTTVWSYLLSQDVDALDYAVCTHPDADHIGGMDVVLYKMDCASVLMPAVEHDTETYEELIRTIGQRNQKVSVPKMGETYALGEAKFQVLTDTEKRYGDNNNDYSIAIRLTFGETSFLLTGDAEVEAEQDMLQSGLMLESDVYKVAHHGANTANTEAFLTAVNPDYAVISCGEGNSYGHPRAEVLNNLRSMGVKVFRTDEQGTIVAVSDGENITFNCSPSTTWQAGEPTGGSDDVVQGNVAGDTEDGRGGSSSVSGQRESDSQTAGTDGQDGANQGQYVLNTNSKKFHYPTCGSVDKMSEKNKAYSNQSREELIAQGYEPCRNCEP